MLKLVVTMMSNVDLNWMMASVPNKLQMNPARKQHKFTCISQNQNNKATSLHEGVGSQSSKEHADGKIKPNMR